MRSWSDAPVGGDRYGWLFADLSPLSVEHAVDRTLQIDVEGHPPAQRAKRIDARLPATLIALPVAAGGNPYGTSDTSGHRLTGPDAKTLEVARYQGQRLARFAAVIAEARSQGAFAVQRPSPEAFRGAGGGGDPLDSSTRAP